MMYMLMQQTRRNLKIFLKDKANIFFSLLSPLIVLALYVLFLGRTQTDSMMEALTQMGLASAASEKAVQAFCDSWMLVGCLSCACVTVPMCACGSIIQDKKRGIFLLRPYQNGCLRRHIFCLYWRRDWQLRVPCS